jgi:hypothetical protein
MKLRVSEAYQQLVDKAHWSHAHGRSVSNIVQHLISMPPGFSAMPTVPKPLALFTPLA